MSGKPTRSWLLRIITWDGVLPLVVWTTPFAIRAVLPDRRGAIELAAIILPIVALFLRYRVGARFIATNECSARLQRIQKFALGAGIFFLLFIDAVLVLTHVMPPGAASTGTLDRIVGATLYVLYVLSMSIAMYPGGTDADAKERQRLRETESAFMRSPAQTTSPPPRRDPG